MMKDIEIKISRETRMVDLSKTTIGNDGENLQGNLVFSFTDEFVKGQGRLEYVINGESKYAFLLSDDENYYIPIKSVMTKEGQIDMQLVITEGTDANEIPIFKSNVFYVSCKKSINAEVEEEEEYYSWIEIANTKLNEVDEAIEELATQSNYAKEQGDYAKSEGDNAKSVAEETERKAQEGAFDGKSLEFVWEGTKLGVRLEGQEEYHFVDLQGVQGEIGATGEPFKIKKTYESVSEMNADFENMEFGDYVMIASSVEVEDNAKLYTRGENAWIFISDFSGAMGIRGETGLTPNIQIGEVKTLEAGSQAKVTRSGTDENPLLNFAIPKGDKGDDYVLTEQDKQEIADNLNEENNTRITENEKDIVDLETYLDTITPKSSAKGELVHITDALPLPVFETTADGNVEQETTQGYNFLQNINYYGWSNNSNVTHEKIDDYIKVSMPATPNQYSGIYSVLVRDAVRPLLGQTSVYSFYAKADKDRKINYETPLGGGVVTIDLTTQWQRFYFICPSDIVKSPTFYCGPTLDTSAFYIKDIMLDIGTELHDYEPYTGEQPSPNPEFPSEIEVLEGYNLLPFTNQDFTLKGVHYYVQNGSLYLDGTSVGETNTTSQEFKDNFSFVLPAGTYYFSRGNYNNAIYLKKYSDDDNLATNKGIIVLNEDTQVYIGLYIYQQIFTNQKIELLLVKGNKEKSYLPYSCVGFKVNGKNLLNISLVKRNNSYSYGTVGNVPISSGSTARATLSPENAIIVEPNTSYTLTIPSGIRIAIAQLESDLKSLGDSGWQTSSSYTFTTKLNAKYVGFNFSKNDNSAFTDTDWNNFINSNLQFELGDKATDYEPYQEQIVPLDLKGNWAGAINDNIKDYLVTDKKKYWLVKNIGKKVLDGSESNWGGSGKQFHHSNFASLFNVNINKEMISSHFKNSSTVWASNGKFGVAASGSLWITLSDTMSDMTLVEFKTWLSNNNVEVYYVLAEPQIIELGELPEPIKTFEGVNNIQLLANLDTEIEVKYALDVKKYFENKLASIQEQIL